MSQGKRKLLAPPAQMATIIGRECNLFANFVLIESAPASGGFGRLCCRLAGFVIPRPEMRTSLYVQLHEIAELAMRRERDDHTLQPSALLHEAWLRLRRQNNLDATKRSHYLAAAAETMRRVLVDHARRKHGRAQGGRMRQWVSLDAVLVEVVDQTTCLNGRIDVLALDEALERFTQHHPRAARIVELRFFGGLTSKQIADEVHISLRTVHSDWQFAKAWLYRELERNSHPARVRTVS